MIPNDATLRAVATFTLGVNSIAQNVYHAKHVTATSQEDDDVRDAFANMIEDAMDDLQEQISDDVSLQKVEVYVLETGVWEPLGVVYSAWEGSHAGTPMPSGVAFLIKLSKERTGHQDRKFIAGLCEESCSGDTWGSGAVTAGNAYATTLATPYSDPNGVDLTFCYFDRDTEATKYYTGGAADSRVSYQRRRKPGVGLT